MCRSLSEVLHQSTPVRFATTAKRQLTNNVEGDNITIQPSALSILRHWPRLCKQIEDEQYDCWMSYYRHTGEHVYGPSPPVFNDPENLVGRRGPHVGFMQSRIKMYKALIQQAERCKLDIRWGQRVVDFYEIDCIRVSVGGVVVENGERMEADVVVAADGIKTKSNKLIRGHDVQPRESGLAVYRTAYSSELALLDPVVRERWNPAGLEHPVWEFWLG